MRSTINVAGLSIVVTVASLSVAFAQSPFEVPLTVTDGQMTDTLYFGILPGANFCIVETDGFNGHFEYLLPPCPPCQCFDARFVSPRGGLNLTCFDQGSYNDFRPFNAAGQRDTFRVRAQMGEGTIMVFSWPAGLTSYFSQLTLRYFDQNIGQNVNVNMLTDTTADLTGAGDFAWANIYSSGLVTSVKQTSPGKPAEFALEQNYPNPFNPSTTIKFALPRAGYVTLKVYDVLGMEVAVLVNDELKPGTYEVSFDGRNYPSGVYYYRLTAGEYIETRSMILVK